MLDFTILPKVIKRRRYRILVRPTRQGEFVVFPFGYQDFGNGYVLTLSLLRRLETPAWTMIDSLMITALLCSIAGMLGAGLGMLPLPMVVLGGWHYFLKKRYTKKVQKIAAKARPAPARLTRNRYVLEYASQLSWQGLYIAVGASIFVGCASVTGVFLLAPQQLFPAFICLVIAGVCAAYLLRLARLWQDKTRAFRFNIVAGDPIDAPLPEE